MASKSLTFDLFGRDVSASKAMKSVGNSAGKLGKGFEKAGLGISLGITAATAAVLKFGIDSVKAYADAETQQNKLAFAFKKFPALADTNQKALQKLNTELQNKTRFEDDAMAGAQATLAQYKLTGQQIIQLTPLLADYAQKTGKDLPTAASDLGKAMLGQGRGLKAIGVNFKDTGSLAGNFTELVGALQDKVGGLAEQAGGTAAGKLAIFQNKFGDLQETVGQKLMPVLTGLVDYGNDHLIPFLNELGQSKGIDDFFGTIEKHAKNGDVTGFLDPAAWGNGLQQIKNFFNNGAIDPAGTGGPLDPAAWQHGWDQVLPVFGNGWSQLMGMFANGQQQLSDGWNTWFANLGPGLANGWAQITGAFGNGWAQLMASSANGWAQISGAFGNGWAQIVAKGANGWAQITGAFSNGWSQIVGGFANGWSQIIGGFSNGMGQITGFFGSLGSRIASAVGNLQAQFYSVGANIVQGIVNGVTGMAGRAAASVARVAADMLAKAKAVLGIKSPSRVFRDQVGKQIGAGIVAGVDSTRGAVADSVSSLVRVPTATQSGQGASGPSTASPSPSSYAAAGSSDSGGTTIHLHVNGFVAGSASEAAKGLYTLLVNGSKSGDIPRTIFA